jgi:tetratricopeptide (TPR) repeat protein
MLFASLVSCLWTAAGLADDSAAPRIVVGGNEHLAAGADAIRAGAFDDGIRLTLLGLERGVDRRNRAAGLANLCAAHVAKNEPDPAIPYCTESLRLNDRNWRAYTNRARAYFLKGMYSEAAADNEAAAALNPDAPHVRMIEGLLNERTLRPSVTTEEHY